MPLSCRQLREFDRRAIEDYGLAGIVLMENAGRGCVETLERLGIDGPVVVCCGKGNNGGDGFVIARHLNARGHAVRVVLAARPEELTGDAVTNWAILAKCRVPVNILATSGSNAAELLAGENASAAPAWIVDALLGTGTKGEPRAPLAELIAAINASPARKLAVDLPSGLDGDTGQPAAHTIRADHTCTFVAAKQGFLAPAAQPYLGQVHILEIGAPRPLVEEFLRAGDPR